MKTDESDSRRDRWRRAFLAWLNRPPEQRGRLGRLAAHQVRLWLAAWRQLASDRLPTVAGDLTFKTLLSLVPILIMVLLVLDMFADAQVGQRVLFGMFEALNIDALQVSSDGQQVDLARSINDMVAAARTRVSAAAVVGLVSLFFLAMNMLATMEGAMNRIWQVSQRRGWFSKAIMFWMVLTLGPILGALAVKASGWIGDSTSDAPAWLLTAGQFVTQLVAVWAVLMLVYKTLPHTRVGFRAALAGALVAGTLWHLVAKNVFGYYLHHAVNYTQVFGSIAVVPLFFLWVYITWIIVLFGCELAYAWQNLDELAPASQQLGKGVGLRDQLAALTATAACARRYLSGAGPSGTDRLAVAAGLDGQALEPHLDRLVAAGLLARVGDEDEAGQYLPARPPADIQLGELIAALGEPGGPGDRDLQMRAARLLAGGPTARDLDSTSLAELV